MSEDTPRIDQVIGDYERRGPCVNCGRKMKQTKTIKAPTYNLMLEKAKAWDAEPICHRKCPQ